MKKCSNATRRWKQKRKTIRNLWHRRDDGGLDCDWRDWDHRDYGRGGRGGLSLVNNGEGSKVRQTQSSTDEEKDKWTRGWRTMCLSFSSIANGVQFHRWQESNEVSQSQGDTLWLDRLPESFAFANDVNLPICCSQKIKLTLWTGSVCFFAYMCECVKSLVQSLLGECPLCDYWKAAHICSVSIKPEIQC